MNVNPLIMGLKEATGLPVSQDIYEGKAKKYIVFNYEDEAPVNWGDNKPQADAAWLQVALYTPISFDYVKMKHTMRDYLEGKGFRVTSIGTWIDTFSDGSKIRHTAISVTYVDGHKYKEE